MKRYFLPSTSPSGVLSLFAMATINIFSSSVQGWNSNCSFAIVPGNEEDRAEPKTSYHGASAYSDGGRADAGPESSLLTVCSAFRP